MIGQLWNERYSISGKRKKEICSSDFFKTAFSFSRLGGFWDCMSQRYGRVGEKGRMRRLGRDGCVFGRRV